jgi:hypothetical protein
MSIKEVGLNFDKYAYSNQGVAYEKNNLLDRMALAWAKFRDPSNFTYFSDNNLVERHVNELLIKTNQEIHKANDSQSLKKLSETYLALANTNRVFGKGKNPVIQGALDKVLIKISRKLINLHTGPDAKNVNLATFKSLIGTLEKYTKQISPNSRQEFQDILSDVYEQMVMHAVKEAEVEVLKDIPGHILKLKSMLKELDAFEHPTKRGAAALTNAKQTIRNRILDLGKLNEIDQAIAKLEHFNDLVDNFDPLLEKIKTYKTTAPVDLKQAFNDKIILLYNKLNESANSEVAALGKITSSNVDKLNTIISRLVLILEDAPEEAKAGLKSTIDKLKKLIPAEKPIINLPSPREAIKRFFAPKSEIEVTYDDMSMKNYFKDIENLKKTAREAIAEADKLDPKSISENIKKLNDKIADLNRLLRDAPEAAKPALVDAIKNLNNKSAEIIRLKEDNMAKHVTIATIATSEAAGIMRNLSFTEGLKRLHILKKELEAHKVNSHEDGMKALVEAIAFLNKAIRILPKKKAKIDRIIAQRKADVVKNALIARREGRNPTIQIRPEPVIKRREIEFEAQVSEE